MAVQIFDENGISNFVDNNGLSGFVDQDGDFFATADGFFASSLIVGHPIIGVGTFIVASDNTTIFSDRVLDFGITIISAECNALFLCSAEPTDYATASSLKLASKTGTIFNSPTAATLGRKVVSTAITDGSITVDGTVTHWAAVDTSNSRLLAHGPVFQSHTILNGQKFTLPAFSLEIDRG